MDSSAIKYCIVTLFLYWTGATSGATRVNTEFRNATVLRGASIEFSVLNFSIAATNTLNFLWCGRYSTNVISIFYYAKQTKTYNFTSTFASRLPQYVSRVSLKQSTLTISNVSFSDEGSQFACEISVNSQTGEPIPLVIGTIHRLIGVYERPSVVGKLLPSMFTVNILEAANLTCKFSGRPGPNVSWIGDIAELGTISTTSRTNGALTIVTSMLHLRNLRPIHNGLSGICTAKNTVGSATQTVQLNVTYVPTNTSLTFNPRSPGEGQNVTIVCSARGNPPVLYYNITRNGTSISVSNTGRITFLTRNCSTESGTYSCIPVSTLGAGQQKDENLLVQGAPTFTELPLTKTVNESSFVSFSCRAEGCPKPDIRFWKNSAVISNNTLSFNSVTLNDAGEYSCQASNSVGSRVSRFTIVVNYPPKNATLVAPSSAVIDTQVTLTCRASGMPAPTYSFFEVRNGSETLLVSSARGDLVIPRIKDDGNYRATYRCSARNLLGSIGSQNATINISVPPTGAVVSQNNLTINATQNFTLVCSVARANPAATLKWTTPLMTEVISPTLVVTNANASHGGNYVCTASNGIGSGATITVVVNVQYAPSISPNVPIRVSSCVGQMVSILCAGTGNPSPTAILSRFQKLAEGKPRVHYNTTLKKADFGNYTCTVRNLVGEMKKNISVVEQDVPGLPTSVSVVTTSSGVMVTWSPPICTGLFPIDHYLVYYRTPNDIDAVSRRVDCSKAPCSYEITGLNSGVGYIISIAAVDSQGRVGALQTGGTVMSPSQRKSDDNIPIYAGAAGGIVLLVLIIVVVIILYRRRKRGQDQSNDVKSYAGSSMYGDNGGYKSSFANGNYLDAKRKNDLERQSVGSSQSKESSGTYKGTFGRKGKGAKSNGVPPSPAFVRSETNNSFIADSDGAYESAGKYNAKKEKGDATSYYASINKPAKRNYADLSDLPSFSPTHGSSDRHTVDNYLKTNYAELADLGPLRNAMGTSDGPSGSGGSGADNYGYHDVNEV